MPNECNIPSRTIFTGDNLDILRGVNSDCVDLIYLDPPFNSNQTYAAPLDSEAKGAEFDDVWTLRDMKEGWIDEIELRMPSLFHLINTGIPKTCRFAKSSPISPTVAQSTGAAFYPSWSSPLCDAQAGSTCLAILNEALHFCSPRRLAYLALVHRQTAIHPVCVDPVTVTHHVRQSIQQSQECDFASVPTSKPFHRFPSASSCTAVH